MNNLKKVRGIYGLTQQELADLVGVSRATIFNSENGKIEPKLAIAVSSALKCNVFDVLGEDVFSIQPMTKDDFDSIYKTLKGIK